jgi:hypothetical protein
MILIVQKWGMLLMILTISILLKNFKFTFIFSLVFYFSFLLTISPFVFTKMEHLIVGTTIHILTHTLREKK